MSKEFKIGLNLDLDTSDAKAALEKFKSNAENTRVEVKVDSDGIKDAEKTSKQLEKTWKELYATSQKLQKQMSKGMLDEGSMKRTSDELDKIHKRMNDIYSKMDTASRKNIDMFNTSQTDKGLANINEALNKIQKTATSLQTKTKGINFDHIDTDKLKEVESKLEAIQDIAKKGIDLDMGFEEIGSIMSELKDIESYIKNLEKVENLASSFDEIRSAASSCGVEIQDFSSEIKQLEGIADNLDGSFDSAFKGLKSSISSVKSELKSLNSETRNAFSSFTGTWSDFTGNFAQFTLAEMAGDLLADGIRRLGEGLVDTVVETDKAMVNLMKVAPETFSGTGKQLDQYLNKVTDTTKKTGSTITDTINGTAKALQTGFKTIDESLAYAQNSTIFANIGDMTQEGADSILASVLSAYGGVANSLKPVREQIKGAGEDYNTMTKFMDLANVSLVVE